MKKSDSNEDEENEDENDISNEDKESEIKKVYEPIIKPCIQYSYNRVMLPYPKWVEEEISENSGSSSSQSAFKNLFEQIELGNYGSSDSYKTGELKKKDTGDTNDDDNDVNEDEDEDDTLPEKQTRKGLTRPTLFMKSMMPKAADGRGRPRSSARITLGNRDNMASIGLMLIQSSQADKVEPIYRKKRRIAMTVCASNFSLKHKNNAQKISDRIRNYYCSNTCYFNDLDETEKLIRKNDHLYQSHLKYKMMMLQKHKTARRLKEDTIQRYPLHESKKSVILTKTLDFSMPHRNFQKDMNRYVKKLKDIAEHIHVSLKPKILPPTKSSRSFETTELFERSSYRLIPTEEVYWQKKEDEEEENSESGVDEKNSSSKSILNQFRQSVGSTVSRVSSSFKNKRNSAKSSENSLLYSELID